MRAERNVWALVSGVFLTILLFASAYRVQEWDQVIITQFGKPVGGPITAAGLHFKLPLIQRIWRFDKRILNWDANPNQIPTKDKKYIWVDTTARWRMTDPLLFLQTVQTEENARSRLDGIIEAATRDIISNYNLVEAVRNSDSIIAKVKLKRDMATRGELPPGEEEGIGEIEPIVLGREKLSEMIIEKARAGLKELGIQIIDVQLRRIAYEASVESKVFERMISERQRIAQKIRSVGLGEQSKIRGKITRDLQQIESEAYKRSETLRGAADATAIRNYAAAMNSDPEFYEFLRTLEAYKKALPADTRLILSADSEFLELLKKK
ncbi:MAG: protease modulator HflC [Elusimicrobiota bacterium]